MQLVQLKLMPLTLLAQGDHVDVPRLVQHDSRPLNRVQRRLAQVQLRTLVGFLTR